MTHKEIMDRLEVKFGLNQLLERDLMEQHGRYQESRESGVVRVFENSLRLFKTFIRLPCVRVILKKSSPVTHTVLSVLLHVSA